MKITLNARRIPGPAVMPGLALILSALFAVSLLANNTLAADFPNIKPGLWDQRMAIESEGGELEQAMAQAKRELEQQLASMPADQREMVEQMMSDQGFSFDLSDQRFQSCVTEEQVEAGELNFTEEECDETIVSRNDKHIEVEFVCPDSGRGRGEMTLHSDAHYTGQFQVETEMEGQPVTLNLRHEGRWLQDDCGGVL